MEPFRFHVYVCTQQKPEGVECCSGRGSQQVMQALDREIQNRGLNGEVQITTCGCMGLCEEGPVMVVYPEGIWYRHVQAADVPEIVDAHIQHHRPVARLVWNDAAAMKAASMEHGQKFRQMMAARDKAGTLPDPLEQMVRSFMPSRCLLTALELNVFTAIVNGATAEQIGTHTKCDTRAIRTLLDALVALKLLQKEGNEYRNTPETSRYFVQGSKDNHRNGLLHSANIWHRWSTLTDVVRKGKPMPVERAETSDWTLNFINGMDRNAKSRAPLVVQKVGTQGVRSILDLGGGSGAYSIAFAKASPEIHCAIIDLPEVVEITNNYVNAEGVADQISVRRGNMLDAELGTEYDIVMLNAICHMFSAEQNRALFRRTFSALAPGGRLVVQDFIVNPDRTSPQQAALFAINMLVGTEAGSTYTEAEYSEWMKDAGYAIVERINLPGPSSLIVGTRK